MQAICRMRAYAGRCDFSTAGAHRGLHGFSSDR